MCKQSNGARTKMKTTIKMLAIACSFVGLVLPVNIALGNVPADADGKDDSQVIVDRIKESLASTGLVSIEQHTGRLLFNPQVQKLNTMSLKQKFLVPAMLVNQNTGLKLVAELPMACFMVSAGELSSDAYQGFRQHVTLRYIRDVKGFNPSRALICEPAGSSATNEWRKHLGFAVGSEPFVIDEHTSFTGERFYYFLNADGSFEMYM